MLTSSCGGGGSKPPQLIWGLGEAVMPPNPTILIDLDLHCAQ